MKRFNQQEDDGDEPKVDISPLIDCVFILLIFFIVTTTFVEEKGVQVEKPQASADAASESNAAPMIFVVMPDGKIQFEGRDIGLGGIRPAIRRRLQEDPKTAVIVSAAEKSRSGAMVKVIDEAKLAGAEVVNIASQK